MSQMLDGKIAVVTGGGSGIGRSIVERFLSEGAAVAIFARTAASLQEIVQQAPDRVLAIAGDVTVQADLERLVEASVERFGTVDI
jgi:NAD(P)-dependent dehydrogenase (short-subunit alcohol dehydrogenase family)